MVEPTRQCQSCDSRQSRRFRRPREQDRSGIYQHLFYLRNKWIWTEKIDGTNIRIHWDGHKITFGGRTDNAAIPADLITRLNEIFINNAAEELFEQTFGEKEVIIFGEGYGRKIQKVGSKYIEKGVDFIIFDVLIGENYQEREWVEKIAQMFGLKIVPIVGTGNLYEAVKYICNHPNSVVAEKEVEMEGIVCRPAVEMRNRRGERVIVKIKWCDIREII